MTGWTLELERDGDRAEPVYRRPLRDGLVIQVAQHDGGACWIWYLCDDAGPYGYRDGFSSAAEAMRNADAWAGTLAP